MAAPGNLGEKKCDFYSVEEKKPKNTADPACKVSDCVHLKVKTDHTSASGMTLHRGYFTEPQAKSDLSSSIILYLKRTSGQHCTMRMLVQPNFTTEMKALCMLFEKSLRI